MCVREGGREAEREIHRFILPCRPDTLMDEEDLLKKAYDDYEAGAYSPKLLKPADVDEVRTTIHFIIFDIKIPTLVSSKVDPVFIHIIAVILNIIIIMHSHEIIVGDFRSRTGSL